MAAHPDGRWSWNVFKLLSWLTFGYIGPVIRTGYKRMLQATDFPPVPSQFESARMADRLFEHCKEIQREVEVVEPASSAKLAKEAASKGVHSSAPDHNHPPPQHPVTGWRLLKALFKTFAPSLFVAIAILMTEALMEIIEVYSMGNIILFLQQLPSNDPNQAPPSNSTTAAPPTSQEYTLNDAYMYAVILSICSFLHGVAHQHGFFAAHRLGFCMRTATISLLYRKTLLLSKQSMSRITTGHITNLISTDVERFLFAAPFFPFFIVSPVHAIVSTYLIWRLIGPFALCGMALIVLMVPAHMLISRLTGKLRGKSAAQTDKRVKITSELLSGMRVIKMYAWEQAFAKIIQSIRTLEIKYIETSGYIKGSNLSMFFCMGALVTLVTFVPYQLAGNLVTAYNVFTCYAYYNYVKLNMSLFLPNAIHSFSEMRVSLRRIEEFIVLPEHQHDAARALPAAAGADPSSASTTPKPSESATTLLGHEETNVDDAIVVSKESETLDQLRILPPRSPQPTRNSAVIVDNMTCEWLVGAPVLRNVSCDIKENEILCVAGPVGSGKTTLLMALLQEIKPLSGSVHVRGTTSYSSQESWILSMSIRENILFGESFDPIWYQQVVEACALSTDFARFPDGDATEVGERGVTLSGGQKARLSLARAVYANRDILLLDDPLSAVDTRVGKHIFQNCLCGLLRNRIRILVTHQVQYLPYVDRILLLNRDGNVVGYGSYEELVAKDLLRASGLDMHTDDDEDDTIDKPDEDADIETDASKTPKGRHSTWQVTTTSESGSPATALVKAEDRQSGVVKRETYMQYWLAERSWKTVFIVSSLFSLLIIGQAASVVSDWFLSYWVQLSPDVRTDNVQPLIYSMLVVALLAIGFYRGILFFQASMHSSRYLHSVMFEAILKTPILFFDTNPVGRILNRFSKDLGLIDDYLVITNFDGLQSAFTILGVIFFVSIVNPWIFLFTVPLMVVFGFMRQYYLPSGRDIKRIEATERSPIFSHLGSTLTGIPTIRCHNASRRFVGDMDLYLDGHGRTFYMFMVANRWLGFRLDFLSAAFVCVTVFAAIALRSTLSAGLAALSLSYTLQLTGAFQWMVRQSTEVESLMVSVERSMEYSKLEAEQGPDGMVPMATPENWPATGAFEFRNVTMRYNEESSPALENINFAIKDKEKIGVVGRTGAGKSSLLYVLFRLSRYIDGDVLIDGVATSKLDLRFLRSKISVIPQDPTLFSGTLRYNVDPFDMYSDHDIWNVLADVQLKSVVENLPGKLNTVVSESGGNFSVGQRQLICLARAALRRNKILVLDEATANVDNETDAMIQAAIRRNSEDCTVFTIAHRLHTVMDSDKILVLDAGRVVEFDTPFNLLQRSESVFSQMVSETNAATQTHLRDIARECAIKRHCTVAEL